MARLGDVCIINPKVPPIDDSMLVSFVPMQRVGEEGEFDPSELRTYADVKKGFTYFADADVLFAKITPCMENGKGAIACGMESGIGFGSTEFHVLRPNKKMMMGEWLYYLTVCPTFRKEAERNMTGSAGQKRVPKSFLENYHVNIPVLSEQHQQVQVLNNICALLSLRKQQLAKLDELVKSRFIELFGDPEQNPRGLPVLPWNKVFLTTTGKLDSNAMVENGQYPFFTCAKESFWIDTYAFDCEALLLAGNNAAGVYDVKHYKGKFNAYQRTYVLRLIDKQWSYKLFKRQLEDKLRYLQSQSKGTNTRYLTLGILNELRFIVPPVAEQEQFAAFVEQTDKSKLAVQQSLDKLETLKKSLMQKYFG